MSTAVVVPHQSIGKFIIIGQFTTREKTKKLNYKGEGTEGKKDRISNSYELADVCSARSSKAGYKFRNLLCDKLCTSKSKSNPRKKEQSSQKPP